MSIEFIRNGGGEELRPRISVIGVGGAGGNAIGNMIAADVAGVEFVVANTDAQSLNVSSAETRIQLGPRITEGLGAGSRPEIGRAAAEETLEQIEAALDGSHMCFIAAGMGGGTGTGAAPVIAEAARKRGILTVGVVTKPFSFEGTRRMKSAEAGIEELQQHVDTLIVIPNQNLFLIANPETTFKEAFAMADEVLQQGVRGITDLMVMPGLINLDFADVRAVMEEMGKAMMGTGEAEGEHRAREAAERAIANPLLDGLSMRGAKAVIISITGGDDMRLMEVDEAANYIKELVDADANIIFGSAFNNDLNGKLRVSVVATGIEVDARAEPVPARVVAFPNARERAAGAARGAGTPAQAAVIETASAPVAAVSEAPEAPLTLDPPETAPEPETSPIAAEATAATGASPIVFDDLAISPPRSPNAMPRPGFTVRGFGETPRTVTRDQAVAKAPSEEDELMLDPSSMVAQPAPAPAENGARKWLAKGETLPERPAEAARPGGSLSLFERMAAKAHRGAPRDEGKSYQAGDDEIDMPRFMNRQGNQ